MYLCISYMFVMSRSTREEQASTTAAGKQRADITPPDPPQDGERKRRPGRPRGSKNRRTRALAIDKDPANAASKTSPAQHGFYQYTASPAPGEIQPHNQQYYEFQWRVLNLCAEFYGAAEELVVSLRLLRDHGVLKYISPRKLHLHLLLHNVIRWALA